MTRIHRRESKWLVRGVSKHAKPELAHQPGLRFRARTSPPDDQVAQFISAGPPRLLCNRRDKARLARLESADEMKRVQVAGSIPEQAVVVLVERDGTVQPQGDKARCMVLEKGR